MSPDEEDEMRYLLNKMEKFDLSQAEERELSKLQRKWSIENTEPLERVGYHLHHI